MPHTAEVSHDEAIDCLKQYSLMEKGIGIVDLHLVASTPLATSIKIWTRDKRPSVIIQRLDIAWTINISIAHVWITINLIQRALLVTQAFSRNQT